MAKFQAPKGYHFSKDGTDDTTWAHFTPVAGSDPQVYEFDTTKQTDVARLRKLAEAKSGAYSDIVEVDEKADKPAKSTASKSGKSDAGQGDSGQPGDSGQSGDGGAEASGNAGGSTAGDSGAGTQE